MEECREFLGKPRSHGKIRRAHMQIGISLAFGVTQLRRFFGTIHEKGVFMSTPMMRKVVRKRSRHAVVALNDVCHIFATATPESDGPLQEQVKGTLEAVAEVMSAEGAEGSVIHQTVFLANSESTAAVRQMVREFYGSQMPATNYVAQPPCTGKRVAIEALGLGQGRQHVEIQRISDQIVVIKHNGVDWVYADHAVPQTSATGVYEKTICSYQHLRRLLPIAGAHLDQVLRTRSEA